MSLEDRYNIALELLAAAQAAYKRALLSPQHVRQNFNQKNDYDIQYLGAEVDRRQKIADMLEAQFKGTVRPGIVGPLRLNL